LASKRDYYEVLGVDKNATENEIKSAFRQKAKECHPDLHPGDKDAEAKFKEINEAAEVLSDAKKRAQYDQFGHAAFDPASGGGSGGYENPFSGFGGFTDIFETMFGGGFSGGGARDSNGPAAGRDLKQTLTISFEDAAFGAKREILVQREQACASCGGTGAKPGTKPERCPTCGGSGQVRMQQSTMLGSFTTVRPCTACRGTGHIIKEPCLDCHGEGRVRKTNRVVVNIPAGIDDGQTLSMPGEGEAGYRGGPNGNLFVLVRVKPHKLFRRQGADLYLDMKIPFLTATLGGDITVPTLTGSVKYGIPEGTQPGTTFRMREQGIQRLRSSQKGDLLVKVDIDVPKRLSEEQKTLLRAFGESLGEKPAEQRGGSKKSIFNKVKDALNNE